MTDATASGSAEHVVRPAMAGKPPDYADLAPEELRRLVRDLSARVCDLEAEAKANRALASRQSAEADLRFHEVLFDDMGAIAKVGGWQVDVATGDGIWSAETARIFDIDPAMPVPPDIAIRYFVDDHRRVVSAAFNEAILSGTPYDLEVEIVSAAGARKWVRTIGRPIVEDGQVVRVVGTLQDITDRKEAEQRILEMSEVQTALVGPGSLSEKLKRITDGVVEIFDADFARVWLIRPGDRCRSGCVHAEASNGPPACQHQDACLHLVASSGRYTRIEGSIRSRMPLGHSTIGMIASGEQAVYLSNDVLSGRLAQDRAWAEGIGLAAFAGYQLRPPDGRTIGVLALFSKRPILAACHALLTSYSKLVVPTILALEAEHARAESEALLREVGSIAQIGGWEMDFERQTTRWTRTTYDLVGFAADEPVPAPDHYIGRYVEQDRPRVAGALRALIEHDLPLDIEARANTTNRGVRWFKILGRAVREDGRPVVVRGTLQDITDRKEAEEAIRESESRFRSLIERAPEAVFVQAGGVFRYVNEAMARLLGARQSDDLVGRRLFDFVSPDCHDQVRDRIRLQQESHELAPPMEQTYLRVDGVPVTVETTAVAMRFEGRDGHLVFVRDVTARKRADSERINLEAQLQQAQKLESVGRLAGGVAHDFNNLLMGIMGHAELCRDELGRDHPASRDLDEILDAAQRSAAITRQLLAFARRQPIAPVVLDINDHVTGTIKLLRRLIGEDIQLAWVPKARHALVKIDPAQLDQVLANLAVNARDAIAGVGRVTVESGELELDAAGCVEHPGAAPGRYVMLALSDSGCGMDRDTISHIFEPFFTTKASGEGTGLGLATVYGVVSQNEGLLKVDSEVGKGTTFRVYFKQHGAESAEATASAEKPLPGGTETVMLVEDARTVRLITSRVLQALGYNVLTAANGIEALQQASQFPGKIHLLITDVIMPGMSGRDLSAKLAEIRPETKRLFISGYTGDVIANRGVLEAGVQFLPKPFSRHDLARKVREVLESY
jgi:PAS domain S-box-containing protein